MSWKFMNMLNLYQSYVYIPKYSYQTVRLLSSKELSFIKGAVNQDILLQSLKSASSTDNILELVSTHHKIMNNKQLMQALRSLFILQKSGSSNLLTKQIVTHADFKTLCVSLKYHVRSIELNETVEALKILSYVGVPSKSTIFQTLMQMIRQHVNTLTLQQIIFLDFLLKQVTVTPLSDALLIALPIVFEVQLPHKMDADNFSQLTDLLQYATRNRLSERTVNHLLNALGRHTNKMDVRGALSIVWSLCDLKQHDSFASLLKCALSVVVQSGEELRISDLETTLTKLTYRYNAKYAYYFNREYFDLVAEHTIDNDLDYQQAIWILQKFSKVGYIHTGLLDYISTLCHTDHTLVSNSTPWNLFILVSGFAGTDYRPRYWESIRQGILENENLYKARREFNWIKFTTRLAMLDLFIPRVLEKAFSHEYVEKIVQDGVFINCLHLLTLYQTISTLHVEYSTLLPTAEQIDTAVKHVYRETIDEYRPLHAALERGFGDKKYVLTNVTTKLGHVLHHVVVMRKGGYPVAFKDTHGPVLLEDLHVPPDSHIVAIYGCEPSYYIQDSTNLKNLYNLMFKTVEAIGCSVVPVPVAVWTNMPDYEKIPYLMAQVRYKNEEFEKLSAVQR